MSYWNLGASLYVPATRADVLDVALGAKLAHARSLIFCTEDSIREADVPDAIDNLASMLAQIKRTPNRLKFIRVRNPEVLRILLGLRHIEDIDGFVLPKLTADNLDSYVRLFADQGHRVTDFYLMPTLETKEVFNPDEMRKLCQQLSAPELRPAILCLRIGGNDLLNLLGVRRSRHRTIYESALGPTMANLVTIFRPNGFHLTSPVCEFLYDHEVLKRELEMDVEYGIYGKTAIHPDQIALIEQAYAPSEQDARMADAILQPDAPAVFNMYGTMCEVATHTEWAKGVVARGRRYGRQGTNLLKVA